MQKAVCALALAPAALFAGVRPAPVDKNPVHPAPQDPCAGPISYTNVELIYEYTDFDAAGFDNGDGVALRFEYELAKQFYIKADVDYSSYDFVDRQDTGQFSRGFGVDQWTLTLGVGGHIALTENIHLAGDAGLVYTDISGSSGYDDDYYGYGDDSETGWYIRPHIRAKWGCLTVHAGASYVDLGDDADEWAAFVKAYYQITPVLDLTAGYSGGEEADVWSAGVRYRF